MMAEEKVRDTKVWKFFVKWVGGLLIKRLRNNARV